MVERKMNIHPKYPQYKSLLIPILSWNEIEENIINKYETPIKYNKTVEPSEIDDLIKKHTDKYQNVGKTDLTNTLKYLFNSYKEFCYFSIRNGKIKSSYQIYNTNYTNEWYKNLSVSEGKNFNEFFTLAKKKVHGLTLDFMPPQKWYANNCLIRMENWGDMYGMSSSYLAELLELLEYCMTKYDLPDCDFIFNRKDFALLTMDKSNAYYSLYSTNSKNTQPDNCWFVLSQSGRKQTLDITVPTSDEWKFITKTINTIKINDDWNTKKDVAVWRGSTTGCGVTKDTNPRIKLATIAKELYNSGYKNLDAGVVQFTKGFKVTDGTIHYINQRELNIPKLGFITYEQQTNNKYMLNIEGNTAAYRFSTLFYSGSLVLNINSKFKLWFEPLLTKNENYISIKKNFDKQKLKEVIEFLKNNNDTAKYIADSGKIFFNKYIKKDIFAEYWFKIMIELNKKQL